MSQVVADGTPAGTLITVSAQARDFADNAATASRTVRVVVPPVSLRGIVTGEVYDDTTGLPLEGVSVSLDGTDSTSRRYTQATTTDARGRYLLRATAGTAVVRIERAGHTRVDRVITIAGGVATEAFDARLTPYSGAATPVSPTLGATLTSAGATLGFDPGTLATATALQFAAVSAQGLRALLPAGWSPVLAVDVAPAGVTFAGTAIARATNVVGLTPGTPLVLVQFDAAARAWRVVSIAPLAGDGSVFEAALPSSGQFALLVGDAQPEAPQAPVVGQVLAGVPAPVLPTTLTSVVVPQPRVLFYAPGVRSLVTGRTEAATRLSSGARVLARITERYDFFDGGAVTPEPFEQDLVFYQVGAAGLAGTHVVSPSQAFEAISLREGVITVAMYAPATSPAPTPIVSPDGTRIEAASGEALVFPAGAVSDATPVTLAPIPSSTPGISVPDGVTVLGGASVSSPSAFLKGASLSIARQRRLERGGCDPGARQRHRRADPAGTRRSGAPRCGPPRVRDGCRCAGDGDAERAGAGPLPLRAGAGPDRLRAGRGDRAGRSAGGRAGDDLVAAHRVALAPRGRLRRRVEARRPGARGARPRAQRQRPGRGDDRRGCRGPGSTSRSSRSRRA